MLSRGIDSVVSWSSNQVLLSDPDLSLAGVLLIPTWVWLIISLEMGSQHTQSWSLPRMPARPRTCFVAAVVVCVAVVVGGFVLGAAKGPDPILPGHCYKVSRLDINTAPC